jgi:hypothetical protein
MNTALPLAVAKAIAGGLALPALLAGCAAGGATEAGAPAAAPIRAELLCDDGQTIHVTFTDGVALVDAGGRQARLTQQPSGSGIHYAGDGADLRGKGPDNTWTDAAGVAHACREQRAAR